MFDRKAKRLIGFITLLALSLQSNVYALSSGELKVDDVQSLFYQIIALLGLSLFIYLYINFRNNRKSQRQKPHHLNINHEAQNISNNLQQVVDLIPYPACISNEKQKVIYFNSLYSDLIDLSPDNQESNWDKQLRIDLKKVELDRTELITASSQDNKRFKLSIRPISISDVNIQLFTIIIEDISNIKESHDEKAKLKDTIHNANLPIAFIDAQLNIADFNKYVTALIKADSQKLYQKPILSLLPYDEHDAFLSFFNSQNESIGKKNFHLITSDNNLVPVEIHFISFKFKGDKACLLLISDISERKQLEGEMLRAKQRAEESDRLKSSFLANMSHEVRTPLNSIMGFTELMCDDQLTSLERKEFHNIVKSSSNELLRLLSDIMEFSKIESGLINLNIQHTYAHEIVNELQEYVAPLLATSPNIKFNIEEPLGFDVPAIITDKDRVKQTLRHLIDNALKFTYNGSITLSYQYRPDDSVEFIISDTGIGIPKEKVPSIFHKFRQANDDNSRDFGGAGLGLSICKHLANALGGFLWVSSMEKVGSDFHFIIPADGDKAHGFRYHNTLVFYSKQPKSIPVSLEDAKILSLFQFTALLNIPLAHDVSVIILNEPLTEDELSTLKAVPQVRKVSIILYGSENSKVIYSPIEEEINNNLGSNHELRKYIIKCFERKTTE